MPVAIALAAYLAASFLLSALAVRAAPRSWLGRKLRMRLWLFPALPLLLLIAAIRPLGRLLAKCLFRFRSAVRLWFELLSGHRTFRRIRYGRYYGGENLPRYRTRS